MFNLEKNLYDINELKLVFPRLSDQFQSKVELLNSAKINVLLQISVQFSFYN